MTQNSRKSFALFAGVSLAAFMSTPANAQQASAPDEGRVTGEIVVTAEKREASIQEVPIAISAFDSEKLERLQINDGQDLAQAIPNFQFSKANFTGTSITIRGVGNKVVASGSDNAVGIHLNGTPMQSSPIFEAEFFDTQRVEVLRGPQGTLYGRNATSGVLNIITNRPEFEVWNGSLQGTYGNYNTIKTSGHLNVPIGEDIALRVAGFMTKRDGFIDNVATGNDIDGRDMYAVRASLNFDLSPRDNLFIMAQIFEEDSSRSRIGKQLCTPDTRAWPYSQGCLGGVQPGFGAPNTTSTLAGAVAFAPGTQVAGPPFGAAGFPFLLAPVGTNFSSAAGLNPPDFRKTNAFYDPKHEAADEFYQIEYSHDFDIGKLTFLTAYQSNSVNSKVDFLQVVPNVTFTPNVTFPAGVLGASAVPLTSATGAFNTAAFGNPQTATQNTLGAYDQSRGKSEQFTQEVRFVSDLDGPLNFTIGGIYISSQSEADYLVFANTFSYFGTLQGSGPDLRYFYSDTQPYDLEASALFGEVYYEPTDGLRFTVGLRQTSDEKSIKDRQTLLGRTSTGTPAQTLDQVPFLKSTQSSDELTGRAGVNWITPTPFSDETNFYAFYSRGYKGGGINPPVNPAIAIVPRTFEPEFVNAIEVGMKNVMFDGRLSANLIGFSYDYEGYQISKIINQTAVNENVDAKLSGAEGEFTWEPVNGLVFDMNVSYLKSDLGNVSSFDPLNPTNGDARFTVVKNLAGNQSNCIVDTLALNTLTGLITAGAVPRAQVGAASGLTAAQAAGLGACTTLNPAAGAAAPTTLGALQGSLAALMGRAILTQSGSPGIARQLNGNLLPATPEWQFSLGAQYTFAVTPEWDATIRGDYFSQAESFSRIFNTVADKLDGYDQINASLKVENKDGFFGSLFVRNLGDEDVITDRILTDQAAGLFQNAFLLEPRTYGITVGRRW